MPTAGLKASYPVGRNASDAGEALLRRLCKAHDAVLQKVAQLEQVLAADRPQPIIYSQIRFDLSKASRERRSAFAAVYAHFTFLPDEKRAGLDALRRDDAQSTARSNVHVQRWTLDAIQSDWHGYRRASAEIRAAMRERIAREQSVVYPLFAARPSCRSVARAA